MAGRSHLPVMLLAVCCLASAGPLTRSPCELLPVGAGHPVQAVLKSLTAMAGCASRGTASLPQEVHVINLRGYAPELPGSTPAKVELHLKPIPSMLPQNHQKRLVFVLNSLQPLIWNVEAENLELDIEHTFHVLQGSQVYFEQANSFMQMKEESLPHGNDGLLSWALSKYGAVTSFSELKITQVIYIKVGEDKVFPDTCKIDSRFVSLNYLGSYEDLQPSKGCVLSAPEKKKEVHILELQTTNSSSAFQVDVTVDLRPLKDNEPVARNVVLLLRCAKPVNWVVRTHNVDGTLEIVASNTVTVKSQMTVTKSPKQSLPIGPQDLITWAQGHGYSPATSYTSTPVANHFNIRLRNRDVVDPLETKLPPEFSILQNSSPEPGAVPVLQHSGLPFPFPPHFPATNSQPWDSREPSEQPDMLSIALSVQCEEKRMVVFISKESLKAKGFTHANVTLQDPECRATANATHYTLETTLTGCQTIVYPMQNSPAALHINSVRISLAETNDGSGGPPDSEDLESEGAMFLRALEPRRTISQHRQHPSSVIHFNCTYRKNQGTRKLPYPSFPGPTRKPVTGVTFNMNLYGTQPSSNASRQSFFPVSQNQQVFVEITSTASDPDLGLTIVSCFISNNSNPKVESKYYLIQTVCSSDDSVRFYPQQDFPIPPAKMESKSFSFTFNSTFKMLLLFLHCETSLCSKSPNGDQSLPLCVEANATCQSLTLDNIMKLMVNAKTSTKTLLVLDSDLPVPDGTEASTGTSHTEIPATTKKSPGNSHTKRILYLIDTPTVVGIAFAAFVIGVLLTGALWFIYSHTGESAATQAVQKSQHASENSSAAHSIGSTQSTPCSSSSTA